jgi:dolichol-phosphate mannosyltransferase
MEDYMQRPWVIVPTYNEAGNITPMTSALLALDIPNLHLMIVDDDSPDGTGALADELAGRADDQMSVMHRTGERGLGRAYLDGFRHALSHKATAIVQMDCDFSHQPKDVHRLLKALSDADVIIGSRYVEGGSVDPTWGVQRKALSAWGNFYARVILGITDVKDATGGFRAWKHKTLDCIGLDQIRSQGYAFQVEMSYVAWRMGFKIKEIPIHFPDRMVGESKMSLKVQLEAAYRVWEVRWRHRNLPRQKD